MSGNVVVWVMIAALWLLSLALLRTPGRDSAHNVSRETPDGE